MRTLSQTHSQLNRLSSYGFRMHMRAMVFRSLKVYGILLPSRVSLPQTLSARFARLFRSTDRKQLCTQPSFCILIICRLMIQLCRVRTCMRQSATRKITYLCLFLFYESLPKLSKIGLFAENYQTNRNEFISRKDCQFLLYCYFLNNSTRVTCRRKL